MVSFTFATAQLLLLSTVASVQGQKFTNSSGLNAHSPPRYPSPWIRGSGDWEQAYAKAQAFVSQLTLLEKVNLTTGTGWQMDHCVGNVGSIPRLGFAALCLQDSPTGVRFGTYSSAFSSGMNAAMTWDRDLMYNRGFAMGSEFKGKGVNFALGPVAGPLGRAPEGGRNWEGFSPDPFLTGIGMSETIQGMQDAGVVATAKHFIGNEQEHFRQVPEATGYGYNITWTLSSNIDDRTMHELYLWPFADAVRAGVGAIMCSYNQVNNSQACQNSYLLNGLLKGELDFQGVVMSDWQAQHAGVDSALAGLDMSMPGDVTFDSGDSWFGANLTLSVLNGTLPESKVTDMATRIMAAYFKVGQDPDTYPATNFDSWTTDDFGFAHFFAKKDYGLVNQQVDVRGDHFKNIQEVAAKGTVLLKNVGGVLPLGGERQIGLFGSDLGEALYGPNGCPDRGCDNGTLALGWGSGTSNFPYLITPQEAIKARALQEGTIVQSVLDDYAYAQINSTARQASVCIVGVSADSGEGYINVDGNEGDRKNLTLWNSGDILINTVASQCNNTVVVIHAVGVVLVEDFIDHPNVTAVLFAGLPGQESGNALAKVLYGDVNPSGKLPFTWGKKSSDYGTDVLYEPNGLRPQLDFSEGLFIDYRYFDKQGIEPRFEFGYGLSYTTFNLSQLYVARIGALDYISASGSTPAVPAGNTTAYNPADFVFPASLNRSRIEDFIYPYIESTSLVSHPGTNNSASYPAPAGAFDTSAQPIPKAGGAPGGNPSLYEDVYEVSAIVTNTGDVAGEEVAQVYLATGLEDDPVVVLRGFEKVYLVPGQSTMVRINLNRKDLARWDVNRQDWVITNSTKEVRVGTSSRNTPLTGKLPI